MDVEQNGRIFGRHTFIPIVFNNIIKINSKCSPKTDTEADTLRRSSLEFITFTYELG